MQSCSNNFILRQDSYRILSVLAAVWSGRRILKTDIFPLVTGDDRLEYLGDSEMVGVARLDFAVPGRDWLRVPDMTVGSVFVGLKTFINPKIMVPRVPPRSIVRAYFALDPWN